MQEYNLQAARAGGHRAHPHPTSDRPASAPPWRRSTLRLSTRPTRYRSCSERCRRQQQVVDVRQQPRRGPQRRDRTAARRRAAAEPGRLHVDGRSSGGREAGDQRPDVPPACRPAIRRASFVRSRRPSFGHAATAARRTSSELGVTAPSTRHRSRFGTGLAKKTYFCSPTGGEEPKLKITPFDRLVRY